MDDNLQPPKAAVNKAQIEVIPCKICGDKRSQSGPVNYQCPRNKQCVIDRVNRNRCQYCRLQKCLALGMSRDAVKFGRMSKKQREKVEGEAQLIKAGVQPGVNGYAHTELPSPNNNSHFTYNTDNYVYSPNGYVYGAGESTSPVSPPANAYSPTATPPTPVVLRTVDLLDNETIAQLKATPVSSELITLYQNMTHRQVWAEVADKLTFAVQQIIEFAKMVPGFMDLSQDDQIMLLKAGSFELALLRCTTAYDGTTDSVIFGDRFVPLKAFSNLNIQKLYEKITSALKLELGKNNREDENMITKLNQITWIVRNLNTQHINVLNKFKQAEPDVEFPALHKELFSVEGQDNS
ncbi:HR3-like protein [Mya arenaria]|uniref:HR3-like protein n=1 Tax=Mya arenaria TaxID=6604 RepID=A0ABY7G947_MYAAR|nr:HR3-like protein [Mya arenaria]